MKNLIRIVLFVLLSVSCTSPKLFIDMDKWNIVSQDSFGFPSIKINGLYNCIGVIFYNDSLKSNIPDEDILFSKDKLLFSPTMQQIFEAENIILLSNKQNIYSTIKYNANYYRQYTAYKCENGDTIVIVNMLYSKYIKPSEIYHGFCWIEAENDAFSKYKVAHQYYAINMNKKEVNSCSQSCFPTKISNK